MEQEKLTIQAAMPEKSSEMDSELYRQTYKSNKKPGLLSSKPMAFVKGATLKASEPGDKIKGKEQAPDPEDLLQRLYMPKNERIEQKFQELEKG